MRTQDADVDNDELTKKQGNKKAHFYLGNLSRAHFYLGKACSFISKFTNCSS